MTVTDETTTTEPVADEPTGDTKSRAQLLEERRRAKREELFRGRKYKVLKEISLPKGQVFQTPFGNKGRHGYALEEEGNPSNRFIIGATLLAQVATEYEAVEVPEKERKRRTPEQKQADEAARKAAVEERKAVRAQERAAKLLAQAQAKAEREQKRAAARAEREAKAANAPQVVDPLADLSV